MLCRKCGAENKAAMNCGTCGAALVPAGSGVVVQESMLSSASASSSMIDQMLRRVGAKGAMAGHVVSEERFVVCDKDGHPQEFASLDEMPPEVRQQYDEAMSQIAGMLGTRRATSAGDSRPSRLSLESKSGAKASAPSAHVSGSHWNETDSGRPVEWNEAGPAVPGRGRNNSFVLGLILMVLIGAAFAVMLHGSSLLTRITR